MSNSVNPAVVVDHLPKFLQDDCQKAASLLLGPRGLSGEHGVIFWNILPSDSRFLLVFLQVEKRDVFVKENMQLRELKLRYGCKVTLCTYCKDTDSIEQISVCGEALRRNGASKDQKEKVEKEQINTKKIGKVRNGNEEVQLISSSSNNPGNKTMTTYAKNPINGDCSLSIKDKLLRRPHSKPEITKTLRQPKSVGINPAVNCSDIVEKLPLLVEISNNSSNINTHETKFLKFLINNKFSLTVEEVSYIMDRNGISLSVIATGFSENNNIESFKIFMAKHVSLSGQTKADFIDVFHSYFKSLNELESNIIGGEESCRVSKTHERTDVPEKSLADLSMMFMNASTEYNNRQQKSVIDVVTTREKELLCKLKNLTCNLNDVSKKHAKLQSERDRFEQEVKHIKVAMHKKVQEVQLENKSLRSANSAVAVKNASLTDTIQKLRDNERMLDEKIIKLESVHPNISIYDEDIKAHYGVHNQGISLVSICLDIPGSLPVLVATNIAGQLPLTNVASSLGVSPELLDRVGLKYMQEKWSKVEIYQKCLSSPPGGWGDRTYVFFIDKNEGNSNPTPKFLDSTMSTPTPPLLPITALSTTMASLPTVDMNLSSPPPVNSHLGQGWESGHGNHQRLLDQPMFPSTVVNKGPRIRLNL